MPMDQKQVTVLLKKYNQGQLSTEEAALLETWYNMESALEKPKLTEAEVEQISRRIRSGLPLADPGPVKVNLWPRLTAAAIITIILSAGLFYFGKERVDRPDKTAYSDDVAPGVQGATLTLANGKKIRLNDAGNGEIAKEMGLSVSKTADGQVTYEIQSAAPADQATGTVGEGLNTLSTAKGETYRIRLSDGSLVYLNAASSLTFAANLFEKGKRRVKLSGEAYLEVARDKAHPFVVESRGQEVEVLGTHFNINSYPDDPATATTLLEGSVRINAGSGKLPGKILLPGQQAILSGNGLTVENVDAEEAVAWKDDFFLFENDDLGGVLKKISRWYDVEISYSGELDHVKITGSISRGNSLQQVLKMLEKTEKFKFKVQGRRVIVM